jgi:hypothetical protein
MSCPAGFFDFRIGAADLENRQDDPARERTYADLPGEDGSDHNDH